MGCKHFPYGCGVMRNGDALQPGDCVYNPRYRHPADGGDGPEGGTLVLFDSVSLPHEVMPTVGRERFALSGWFHEAVLS